MKQTKYLSALLLTHAVFLFSSYAQELVYDAIRNGEKVGYLKVSRDCAGEKCDYNLENHVEVSLIWDFTFETNYQGKYQGPYLVQAFAEQFRDGKMKESAHLSWETDNYKFVRKNKPCKLTCEKVQYSSITMYHHEPQVHHKQVFSERFGEYLPLVKKGPHVYELDVPGGTVNEFTYQNGICTKLKVKHTFGSIDFLLRS